MTEAGWTREKPKEAGWYWHKPSKRTLSTIYLVEIDDALNVWFHGNECEKPLGDMSGEWLGPLSPDSFQQGRVAGLREAIQRADEMGNQSSSSHVRSVVGLIVMDLREKLAQQAQEAKGEY